MLIYRVLSRGFSFLDVLSTFSLKLSQSPLILDYMLPTIRLLLHVKQITLLIVSF